MAVTLEAQCKSPWGVRARGRPVDSAERRWRGGAGGAASMGASVPVDAPWTPEVVVSGRAGSARWGHPHSHGASMAMDAPMAARLGAARRRSAPLSAARRSPLTVPVSNVDSHLNKLASKRPFPNRDNFWFGTATRGPRGGVGRRRSWTRRGRAVDARGRRSY